jgi:succinate dehydrogenase / fumarate reductase membrane anchor subunit
MPVNKGLWPWLFQRVSAVVLAVGLFVHFLVLHFMIERPVTMAKVAERLQAPGWIAFDAILLVCALYHALNGVYGVLLDFKPSDAVARLSLYALWAVGGIATVAGLWNLLPFAR